MANIAIVGAGVIGISCAAFLQRDGHSVTIYDPLPPGEGCSFGNAGSIGPGSVVPLSTPGIVRQAASFSMEGDGVQVVELPYRGDELSMLVILPAAGEPKLTPEALAGWDKKLSRELVSVTLPKFKHTLRAEPIRLLRDMGVADALNPGTADFGRMLAAKAEEPIFIANVVHQAFVDVTEEGTEAAAATAVSNNAPSPAPPRPKVFRADRPFTYLIRDTRKGTVLFLGRVVTP